ncbi:hypothetical protein J2S74_001481 [Evansella vedderi]|uniref:Lacto-N-biose phosphorylase central domain-containing protein n=1 Tax=Evansella vedderi TaxID=38282 RepID=A0ABT9ZUH5_9BACI|nr:hypothetical protein [Evansella vedderi]
MLVCHTAWSGGFIGVGEPTAHESQGRRFFQLADVLGVEKDIGYSLSTDKYNKLYEETQFIVEDQTEH